VAALLAAPDTPPLAAPDLPIPALPLIAGLDTRAGLRRVRGKVAFYMSLLRKFADGQNGAVAALREELQAGQPAQAQRRAHTLKSLAASIGIDSVAQQAAQVEALLKNAAPPDTLAPELDLLESLLYSFLLALTLQLPDAPAAATPAQPANAQQLASVCQQLAALLAEDNLEAVECLAEHAALLQTALGERYGAIADAVQRFDCAVALQRLQSGAEWMGINIFSHAGNQ
jgi:two-component system sensor histidine kinase/response regulator